MLMGQSLAIMKQPKMTKESVVTLFLLSVALLCVTPFSASARTLEEIKARGALSMCANPDALPYASQKANPPGFQIEIGMAIAQGLGVNLEKEWIKPRYRSNLVNCDMLLDSVSDAEVHECRLRLTRPYHTTGVGLGVRVDTEVKSFKDIPKGQKIGVMVGSLAQTVLGRQGITTSPYSFEEDMLEDLLKGDLFGIASSPATVAYRARNDSPQKVKIVHAYDDEPQLKWDISIGFRKADPALIKAVDEVVTKMLADGTFKRIYEHYGIEHRPPKSDWTEAQSFCKPD